MSPARIILVAMVSSLLLVGCGKKAAAPTGPPVDVTTTIEQANQLLEDILYAQINGPSPDRPADVDFSPAYAKYQEALRGDPSHPTANFGSAVLGMLSIAQDAEVNAAFDEWKAYLESRKVPFQASTSGTFGVPMRLTSGDRALKLPFDRASRTAVAMTRPAVVTPDPQLGRAQAILRDRALPRLVTAIACLDRVIAIPNYEFTVTPRMQGDPEVTPVVIGHTEFLAMRAACRLLAGLCRMAVAYDVNFAAYDSTSLVTNLRPGSPWMALTRDGAVMMRASRADLLGASVDVDSTINSLLAQTGDLSGHVIKIGPDPAERARVAAIHDDMASFRAALTGTTVITDDWDGNPGTPPVSVSFDFGRFFTNPVQDWKGLLPTYTVSTERRPFSQNYNYASDTTLATVTFPTSGYYYGSYYISVYVDYPPYIYKYGDPVAVQACSTVAVQRLAAIQASSGWTGEAYVSAFMSDSYSAGTYLVGISWNTSWTTSAVSVVVPVITWAAPTFAQWTWPDPTMNGVMPGITSTAELLQTFGVDGEGWERRNVLDWTQFTYYSPFTP